MDNKNEELVNCVLYKKIKRVESAENLYQQDHDKIGSTG